MDPYGVAEHLDYQMSVFAARVTLPPRGNPCAARPTSDPTPFKLRHWIGHSNVTTGWACA
jgi:hypothetical protein